jgi:hypothetical protein
MVRPSKPAAEVETIREGIRKLREESKKLQSALVPQAIALQRVEHHVERMAARAREPMQVHYYAGAKECADPLILIGETREQVADFVAWIDPERLKASLKAEVAAIYSGDAQEIDDEKRTQRLIEIESEIFMLGKREELAIVAAESEGILINRREDADPKAILAVAMEH